MFDIIDASNRYGWIVAILLFFAREIGPPAFNVLSRSYRKKTDSQLSALKTEQEIAIEQMRADRAARDDERKFRHEHDLRHLAAYEKMVELLAVQSKQLDLIATEQASLTKFIAQSIAEMRVVVATSHKQEKLT